MSVSASSTHPSLPHTRESALAPTPSPDVSASAVPGTLAYVADNGGTTVTVIDITTNAVLTTITVGSLPIWVAITPDGSRAYVTNIGGNSVSVIDTATNTVIQTITGVGLSPVGVAITPDGSRAYVTSEGSDTVTVIDITTVPNTVIQTISGVGPDPYWVTITPDGGRAYVSNFSGNSVSVIDISTFPNTVIPPAIGVGTQPYGMAITPDGAKLYVADFGGGTVSVIDTATNTPLPPITVGTKPVSVAITPDGAKAYVPNRDSNSVSVIDTETDALLTEIPGVIGANGVAISPDGRTAYVTGDFSSDTVWVIDTETDTLTGPIPGVGPRPWGIAIIPASSSSTTVTADPNPVYVGQPVTLTATVTCERMDAVPSGSVEFFVDDVSQGSAPLSGEGVATLAVSGLEAGFHTVYAVYSGDNACASSTSPEILVTVERYPSTTTVSADPNPVYVGQPVTLTATVTCAGSEPDGPGGSVEFFVDDVSRGTVDLADGEADLAVSDLAAGSHTVYAVYSGDDTCDPSTSPEILVTVERYPSTITLTATVTCAGSEPDGPGGMVVFSEGTTVLGSAPVVDGEAVLVVSGLAPGTHQITAVYSGDDHCAPAGPTSILVTVANTAITLTAEPNPALVDQQVILTARVVCAAGTPGGTVRFVDTTTGTTLGTASLRDGTATLTTRDLAAGSHEIIAVYSGCGPCQPATSQPVTVVVNRGESITRVTAIPSFTLRFVPVTLTARVTCTAGIPNGTVRFIDTTTGTTLGTGFLLGGSALTIASFRTSGRHQVVAVYSGDDRCEPSTSPAIIVTVL